MGTRHPTSKALLSMPAFLAAVLLLSSLPHSQENRLNDRANLHLFRSQAEHNPASASWQESNYYLRTATTSAVSSASSAFEQGRKAVKGNPFTYNPNWPWAKAGQGRCSKKVVFLPVRTEQHFARRLRYKPTTTVFLVLQNGIEVKEGLELGPRYACTILTAARKGFWLTSATGAKPTLTIVNTSNVAVVNISIAYNFKKAQSCGKSDPEGGTTFVCPGLLVYRSFGVQIAKGNMVGRIQLVRCMYSSVDSMRVTSKVYAFSTNPGSIRVSISGSGPPLLRSGISISNNNIFGTDNGIVLHEGAVGVDVYNNFIHDYGFAGIRCGDLISQQGDCMLTYVFRNYVYSRKANMSQDGDAAGIYFNTHWINPGNLATCNYVYGGDRCYYLDNHSSGIVILGGACIKQRDGGVKINGGKWNIAKFVITDSIGGMPGWAQCLFNKEFNCLTSPGKKWIHMYLSYYNTPAINKWNPWYKTICTATTVYGGRPCNPPGNPSASVTGRCSGMATENLIDVVMVNTSKAPAFRYCEAYPVMPTLNTWLYINKTNPTWYQFLSYGTRNLGLQPTSPLYRLRPSFRSCDSRTVGVQKVNPRRYLNRFNIPRPYGFRNVLTLSKIQFHDFRYNPKPGGGV